jgi:hypothetical protein
VGVDEFDGVFELCGCLLDWGAGGGAGAAYPSSSWPSPWQASWCWWCWKMRSSLVSIMCQVRGGFSGTSSEAVKSSKAYRLHYILFSPGAIVNCYTLDSGWLE